MTGGAASNTSKRIAGGLSVAYNGLSTLVKVAAAIFTGSVSLASEAGHSLADLFASLIAFFSVRAAEDPPDEEHPFGHGKIEGVASLTESVFLVITAIWIFVQSSMRLAHGGGLARLDEGIVAVGGVVVLNFLVGRYVLTVGKRERSLSLQSNGQHLLVDSLTSLGVVLALLVEKLTGWTLADPALGLVFSIWIGYNAYRLSREAFQQLIDRRLPDEDQAQVIALLSSFPGVMSYHRLRTRLSGATRHIDAHVVVRRDLSLVEAHDLVEALERKLREELSPAYVVIHVDPYSEGDPEPD